MSTPNIWDYSHNSTRCGVFYSKINKYFMSGTYTDVNIICQNQIFRCHRLALAAASEYFHHMFCGNFVESRKEDVLLQNIDGATFEQILHYVYTGGIPDIGDENVFSLLIASDFLRMNDVQDFCVHYLTQKNVPMDCAIEIYSFATVLRKKSLIAAAGEFIMQHLDHFRHESIFREMCAEDFNGLLTYFRPSSARREITLLKAILQWVRYSTDDREDRSRSSFMELTRKVEFQTVSAADVAEFLDRNLVDSNDQSGHREVLESSSNPHPNMDANELSLHVYARTKPKGGGRNRFNVFSLRDKCGSDWHVSHTINGPTIEKVRTVALDGRIYCLTRFSERYTFSSSTAVDLQTDMQSLALPSELVSPSASDLDLLSTMDYNGCEPFSLCSIHKDIYLSCFSKMTFDFQRYNTELGAWLRIPALSEYNPRNMVSDGVTRIYLLDERDILTFAAYDPRVGKVEKLNNEGCNWFFGTHEPLGYHKGKIYQPENNTDDEDMSSFKMAIYDPCAGRWRYHKLQSDSGDSYGERRRLVSFNDHLWMFCFDNPEGGVCTHKYDSYLDEWDDAYFYELNGVIRSESKRITSNSIDVIAFKHS